MKYAYLIDNYNALDEFLGVVYTPEDSRLAPVFLRLPMHDPATDVDSLIKEHAPLEVWELALTRLESTSTLATLVGNGGTSNATETHQARQSSEERIPVEQLFQVARSGLDDELDTLRQTIDDQYPSVEQGTWQTQREEAQYVLNGGVVSETTVPYLYRQVETRGIAITELAKKVMAKAKERDWTLSELVSAHRQAGEYLDELASRWADHTISRRQLIDEVYATHVVNYTDIVDMTTEISAS